MRVLLKRSTAQTVCGAQSLRDARGRRIRLSDRRAYRLSPWGDDRPAGRRHHLRPHARPRAVARGGQGRDQHLPARPGGERAARRDLPRRDASSRATAAGSPPSTTSRSSSTSTASCPPRCRPAGRRRRSRRRPWSPAPTRCAAAAPASRSTSTRTSAPRSTAAWTPRTPPAPPPSAPRAPSSSATAPRSRRPSSSPPPAGAPPPTRRPSAARRWPTCAPSRIPTTTSRRCTPGPSASRDARVAQRLRDEIQGELEDIRVSGRTASGRAATVDVDRHGGHDARPGRHHAPAARAAQHVVRNPRRVARETGSNPIGRNRVPSLPSKEMASLKRICTTSYDARAPRVDGSWNDRGAVMNLAPSLG